MPTALNFSEKQINENSGERVVFVTSKTMDFLEFVLWVHPSDSMSAGNLFFKRMTGSEQGEEV